MKRLAARVALIGVIVFGAVAVLGSTYKVVAKTGISLFAKDVGVINGPDYEQENRRLGKALNGGFWGWLFAECPDEDTDSISSP
jgi:hypothetical protein